MLCDDDSSPSTVNSSDFDLRGLQPDPRLDDLLRFSSPEELDRLNFEARQNQRHPELFALYPPTDEVSSDPTGHFHILSSALQWISVGPLCYDKIVLNTVLMINLCIKEDRAFNPWP